MALCIAIGAAAVASAASAPAFEERVTTSRYLIDVVVVDRHGRPVTGLDAGDFAVRIAGAVRPVRFVDRGDPGWSAGAVASAAGKEPAHGGSGAGAGPGRWVMLAFDVDRIPLRYRQVAIEAARAIVERNSTPGTRFGVVQIRSGETETLQPFLPAERMDLRLLDGVGRLGGRNEELEVRLRDLSERIAACDSRGVSYTSCLGSATSEFTQSVRSETLQGLAALRGVAASMGPLPGRKALVWLSEGLIVQPGALVLETVRGVSVQAWERLYNRMSYDATPEWEAVLAEAGRSRVSVFALRTGRDLGMLGLGAARSARSGVSAAFHDPFRNAVRMTEASLRRAAEVTGGKVFLARLTPSLLDGIFEGLAGTYTLGVEALPTDPAGARVRVRVPRGLEARHASRVARPVGGEGRLDGAMTVEPGGAAGSMLQLTLAPRLVGRDADGVSRIAVYLRVATDGDVTVHDAYRIVEFDRQGAGGRGDLIYRAELPVSPGSSTVRLHVADLVGGRRASFDARF